MSVHVASPPANCARQLPNGGDVAPLSPLVVGRVGGRGRLVLTAAGVTARLRDVLIPGELSQKQLAGRGQSGGGGVGPSGGARGVEGRGSLPRRFIHSTYLTSAVEN